MKSGDDQQARLGHYIYGLNSQQGVYVNFTDVDGVGDSHAYFEGEPGLLDITSPTLPQR